MSAHIQDAKRKLPLPGLLHRLGLGKHAKKSARCPFHEDKHNSFSVWKNGAGLWFWKCHAGCGEGDEITLAEKYHGISNKQATKLFLEMAGINGATPPPLKAASTSTSAMDWQECVEAFTDKHVQRLAQWRGYSIEFCRWLRESGLVGLYNGCIAFPVHDRAGNVVAAHYRLKDGSWRYAPQGSKVWPLVIGELISGDHVHVFESYWDGFAFMDISGERSGIIITRGGSNGALVASLIPEGSIVYLWMQNDEAGEKWAKDACANMKAIAKRAKIPAPHKDLNDWTRAAAATSENLLAAMVRAEVVREAPASLSAILDSIVALLRRYVVFPLSHQPVAIALWIAHAWTLDAFDYTAYLHISSPEKQCGKTRLLDCLELLTLKPWRAILPSEAVLFRNIETERPTLLLDEVDGIFANSGKDERREALRALLNAGFESKAKVPRCVGQGVNQAVKNFAVFCAKCLAGIGRLPDTVRDRSVPIQLVRRARDEKVERFRKREADHQANQIRDVLEGWSQQREILGKLQQARPDLPDVLTDRQQDICEPLLAIADMAGDDWPERGRTALITLCAESAETESLGVKLLTDVRRAFDGSKADKVSTQELLNGLIDCDTDAPWATWWEPDFQNGNIRGPARRLAQLLKPYGIEARKIRSGDTTVRGYLRQDFEEAWRRYCPRNDLPDGTDGTSD
jgi:uncharacterized protein DUF3631/CHC2-type zinc finger protein